jgi:endonuclease/exonuclease/phosphatase (EEP) superfamily protein YafD
MINSGVTSMLSIHDDSTWIMDLEVLSTLTLMAKSRFHWFQSSRQKAVTTIHDCDETTQDCAPGLISGNPGLSLPE